jgi:hypothetical protein
MPRGGRTLVVVFGETRAAELTADSFFTNVLEELDADLALYVRDGEDRNPFYERATHLETYPEDGNWAAEFDRISGGSDWRCLLDLSPFVLGGVEDAEHPQIGSAAILCFYRRLLADWLQRAGLVDRYDWFVLTRSDFLWPLPHPPVAALSNRHLYTLDGEHYGGITDRHMVLPRRHVIAYLEAVDPLFTNPREVREAALRFREYQQAHFLNMEQLLALLLKRAGLWSRIRYLPYVPFAVRTEDTPSKWSMGRFAEDLGYFVKYPAERTRSEIAAKFVHDESSWNDYLAPIRGLPKRRRMRRALEEAGLQERAVFPPDS